ncbi:hypothetical protein GF323_04825 [Candidatus Woesearchaeota archaeon]|nr:hypothetical protein [Candidatus Woesearchaeota archaeon]
MAVDTLFIKDNEYSNKSGEWKKRKIGSTQWKEPSQSMPAILDKIAKKPDPMYLSPSRLEAKVGAEYCATNSLGYAVDSSTIYAGSRSGRQRRKPGPKPKKKDNRPLGSLIPDGSLGTIEKPRVLDERFDALGDDDEYGPISIDYKALVEIAGKRTALHDRDSYWTDVLDILDGVLKPEMMRIGIVMHAVHDSLNGQQTLRNHEFDEAIKLMPKIYRIQLERKAHAIINNQSDEKITDIFAGYKKMLCRYAGLQENCLS